jgi:hypothetical protein
MSDNSPKSNPIQEGLRLMNQCPLCKGQYAPDAANVLLKKQGANLVHLTCVHCQNSVLAVIVVTSAGLSSVGMLTDLNATDATRLSHVSSVTEEDVLDFHTLLHNKNFKINEMLKF